MGELQCNAPNCSVARFSESLVSWYPVAILGVLLPTYAVAEVCDKIRPNWDPTSGSVTAWGEATFFFQSPLGIVCLGAFALAVLTFKSTWALASAVGSAGLGLLIYINGTLDDPNGFSQQSVAEGCVGEPTLAVAICATICFICIGILSRNRRKEG